MVISKFLFVEPLHEGEGPYTEYDACRRMKAGVDETLGGPPSFENARQWGEVNLTFTVGMDLYCLADRVVSETGRAVHDIDSMVCAYDRKWIGMSRIRLSKALTTLKAWNDLFIPEFKIGRTRYFDLAFAKVSRTEKLKRQSEFDAMTLDQLTTLVDEQIDAQFGDVPF